MTTDARTSASRLSPQVIVLNGVSSSGTSTVARELQRLLDPPYLVLGVDTLIDALPETMEDGLLLLGDGRVEAGAAFTAVEDAWYEGLAAMARAGLRLILDEVLLGGGRSQRRLAATLTGLEVRWVAVHCDVAVAAERERGRADRTAGMAEAQAGLVHDGVSYDVHVDTTRTSAADCARQVIGALGGERAAQRPVGRGRPGGVPADPPGST